MSHQFSELNQQHIDFIQAQKMYFVGTAAAQGRVNISPKGMDSFRIIDPNHVVWLNLTGSGNETAAHVLENGRMTVMFCSFDHKPLIMRLYGHAQTIHPRDEQWQQLSELFPANVGARQIFTLAIEMMQTSCGYGVPLCEQLSEREMMQKWTDKKGEQGIKEYQQKKNLLSIDGYDTGLNG